MGPDSYHEETPGHIARTGWRGFQQRVGLGGKWAIASFVLAAMSVYLLASFVLIAASDSLAKDAAVLLAMGIAALFGGLAGLWVTVPPPARDLVLSVDAADTTLGGVVAGRLLNYAPGTPLEIAAICRGLHVGELTPLGVGQSTLIARADVDPDLPDQRFQIEIPRDAAATQADGLRTSGWWVIARRPRRRRSPVAAVPITVRV